MPTSIRWRLVLPLVSAAACSASALGCSSELASGSVDGGANLDAAGLDGAAPVDGGDTTPIVAPNDTWTWVDFPTSKCASGTPTGLALNPHAGATELVIYLEGGGACFDAESCWGAAPAANNLTGYDATTFAASKQLDYALLQRQLAGNPLAAMNLVFIPYCTGDMHAGTTETTFSVDGLATPTYFWGATDLELFLARLRPTFAGATRVYLYGTSAGGFGALLDFDRVARAFAVRVDVIDDSGPPILAQRNGATLSSFAPLSVWRFAAPAGCSPCGSMPDVYAYDRAAQPDSQIALLSFAQDIVIAPDFGYTLDQYPAVISSFTASIAGDPRAATFVVTNEQAHVVESDGMLAPQFLPWLALMVGQDPSWESATYAHP